MKYNGGVLSQPHPPTSIFVSFTKYQQSSKTAVPKLLKRGTGAPQNCHGHEKQGKNGQLSQTEGGRGDMTLKRSSTDKILEQKKEIGIKTNEIRIKYAV